MMDLISDFEDIVLAVTALIIALNTFWTHVSKKKTEVLDEVVHQVHDDVRDLKNGELKKKLKEAIREYNQTNGPGL